jgi:predicted house-cleaning noncanonical NTP pyrophosphatase (MazG superfamily)
MAKFILNKLIRDKLRGEYEKMNQTAEYRTLSKAEHAEALKQKLIEEANEIDVTDRESIVEEVADAYQVLEDILTANDISLEEVQKIKLAKFEKKGGFTEATYIETLELADDDDWNNYYRKHPDLYKEIEK